QIAQKVDIVGFNAYNGIMAGMAAKGFGEFEGLYDKARWASRLGKPVIQAEAGIDSVLGEQGFDYGEQRAADYHAKLQQYFADMVEQGFIQGLAIFVLNDYPTPIKLSRFQQAHNRKGL